MLKIDSISFCRGRNEIFSDVSASGKKGELILLTGENGSGKTTLLNCIAGQLKPDSGIISFDNGISYVSDDGGTIPLLTVTEQLMLHCRLNNISDKESRAKIDNIIELFSLSNHRNHRADELSSGLRKKLGLGLCINKDAGLYLFDEPFNSLDTRSSAVLVQLIKLLMQDSRTLIVVTHDPSLLAEDCSRIWNISDGRLTELTDKSEIQEFIQARTGVSDAKLKNISRLALGIDGGK